MNLWDDSLPPSSLCSVQQHGDRPTNKRGAVPPLFFAILNPCPTRNLLASTSAICVFLCTPFSSFIVSNAIRWSDIRAPSPMALSFQTAAEVSLSTNTQKATKAALIRNQDGPGPSGDMAKHIEQRRANAKAALSLLSLLKWVVPWPMAPLAMTRGRRRGHPAPYRFSKAQYFDFFHCDISRSRNRINPERDA